jgi:hypothetical protein
MRKVISLPKNLKRFHPSSKLNLLLLQAFTFGLYNTRLKLKRKGYKFRQSDIVTCLIVGELNQSGCKVSDIKNILGCQISVARNVLNRSVIRRLSCKTPGSKGRGRAATYYLSESGQQIYKALLTEMGKIFDEAKRGLTRRIVLKLNKV